MRQIKRLLGLAIASSALAFPALASDHAGEILIISPAGFSCGDWVRLQSATTPQGLVDANNAAGWIWGYIARASQAYPRGLLNEGVTGSSLKLWTTNYCQAHPLEDIASAVVALERELAARRLGAPSR